MLARQGNSREILFTLARAALLCRSAEIVHTEPCLDLTRLHLPCRSLVQLKQMAFGLSPHKTQAIFLSVCARSRRPPWCHTGRMPTQDCQSSRSRGGGLGVGGDTAQSRQRMTFPVSPSRRLVFGKLPRLFLKDKLVQGASGSTQTRKLRRQLLLLLLLLRCSQQSQSQLMRDTAHERQRRIRLFAPVSRVALSQVELS